MYIESDNNLWQAIHEIVNDEELELYDIERVSNNSLRVVVTVGETPSESSSGTKSQGGVTSEDCARVCKRLRYHIAVHGSVLGIAPEARLEVSSPGINRTLRTKDQFSAAIGERVKVYRTDAAKSLGHNPVVGVLRKVDGDSLDITSEHTSEAVVLPLEEIKKAHVDFVF